MSLKPYGAQHVSLIQENASIFKSNFDFLENQWRNGSISSEWFNIPDAEGNTMIHKLVRGGVMDLAKAVIKCIPQKQLLQGNFYEEDWQDCLATSRSKDFLFSKASWQDAMVAQNGCRAVVMGQDGKILSVPGQSARKLYQKLMGKGSIWTSFQIYLNNDHASIRMPSGEHYGFYADRTYLVDEMLVNFGRAVPCEIKDDSSEKDASEKTNQLMLNVFASEKQVEAMKEFINDSRHACERGEMTYQMYGKNCINFIQDTMQASGTKADFLHAFQTLQYLRRLGAAIFYSLIHSIAHPPPSDL